MTTTSVANKHLWPELKYEVWKDTCQTLHLWTQIIGKIRLSQTPWLNHSWHSPFYLTAQGLTTSVIYQEGIAYSLDFDFLRHELQLKTSDGRNISLPLKSESVASFYDRCFATLKAFDIAASIFARPNEMPEAIPFPQDNIHCSYEPEFAHRFWLALLQADRIMKAFRSRFLGKASPVHFFWGSFDLAVSRFSGRRAPEHPGGVPHLPDLVAREAYSHEVSSCGFWPGNAQLPFAAFYSYAYPKPEGFELAHVRPKEAYYHPTLREFILPYETVRNSQNPDQMLLDFFQDTYVAAADLGHWDREALENSPYLNLIQLKAA